LFLIFVVIVVIVVVMIQRQIDSANAHATELSAKLTDIRNEHNKCAETESALRAVEMRLTSCENELMSTQAQRDACQRECHTHVLQLENNRTEAAFYMRNIDQLEQTIAMLKVCSCVLV
jgi:peptidoglycan hydrolase CwlO-like protein